MTPGRWAGPGLRNACSCQCGLPVSSESAVAVLAQMWPVPCFRCVHKSGPDRCSRPTRSYAASYTLPIGGRRAERCAGCAPLCRSDRSTSFASDDAGLNNITCVGRCVQICAEACRCVQMHACRGAWTRAENTPTETRTHATQAREPARTPASPSQAAPRPCHPR